MPLNAKAIMDRAFPVVEQQLSARDCILYALSIGLGSDPLDSAELPYVYEKNLRAFPTMAVVLGHPGNWMEDPLFGITRKMIVHGSQRLECLAPLPVGETLVAENLVENLIDKGVEKGAIMVLKRLLRRKTTGEVLSVAESSIFCRADGGFGTDFQKPAQSFRPSPKDRQPDFQVELKTQPNSALWYRLNGDWNPLHVDPAMAEAAGFRQPILHGLCTFGLAAVAIDRALARDRAASIAMIETRFSNVVFPGETVTFDIWSSGDEVSFQAKIASRGSTVLDFGQALLGPPLA